MKSKFILLSFFIFSLSALLPMRTALSREGSSHMSSAPSNGGFHSNSFSSQSNMNNNFHQNNMNSNQNHMNSWHGSNNNHGHHNNNAFIFVPYIGYPYYYYPSTNYPYSDASDAYQNNDSYDNSQDNNSYNGSSYYNGQNTGISYPQGNWVDASNGALPDSAIVYSNDNATQTYYCRSQYNNQTYYGVLVVNDGCYINDPSNSGSIRFSTYQVLVQQ